NELPILIEDHHTAVASIGDKEPALTVEGEHVRSFQFAVGRAQMAEGFDEFSTLVELHDARIAERRRMPFGYENVAIRRKGHSGGPVEHVGGLAGLPGFAQSNYLLTVRREFEYLIAAPVFRVPIDCPNIPRRVGFHRVRELEQAGAEILHHLPVG